MSLEVATPEDKIKQLEAVIHCEPTSKAVLSRELTRHAIRPTPHGAWRLLQAGLSSGCTEWRILTPQRTLTPHKGRDVSKWCVPGTLEAVVYYTRCCLWKWPHQMTTSIDSKLPSTVSLPHKPFFGGCSPPFMRLAQHLTALKACCKQCLPGR